MVDLREHFDEVLAALEEAAGWTSSRVQRPVLILGSPDGVQTGVRQLRRVKPLETEVLQGLLVPTLPEMARIKAWLLVTRNTVRDYLDTVVLLSRLGPGREVEALRPLDELYPQASGASVRAELVERLAAGAPEFVRPLESAAPLRWVARLRRSNRFRGERGGGCRSAARRITGRRTTPASGSPDVIWEPHEHARVGAKLVGRRHTKSGAPADQARVDLRAYKGLVAHWNDWDHVLSLGRRLARDPEFVRPLESAAPLRWVARLRRSNRFRGERGGGCRSAARRITGRRTTPASGSPDVIWEPHEHARVGAKLVGRRHTKSGDLAGSVLEGGAA